jgi:hypothetical protein
MRKKYASPVFTYLDFLRSDRRLTPPHASHTQITRER